MKISAIYLMLLFLCSCGQDSNDSGSGSDVGTGTPNIEDIDVSRDFMLIGGETLTVTVLDEAPTIERSYLNICSDFNDLNGEHSVSNESCLLRTSLQGHHSPFKIVISSNQQEFIAQIWPLSNGTLPVNHRWSRADHVNDWQITLC
jgi:hypothetical protein